MPWKNLLIILALLFASAQSASAATHNCKFTPKGRDGGIPKEVVIRQQSDGRVTVIDTFLQNYVGSPVEGKLASSNGTRLLFTWTLPALKDSNGNWVPGIDFSVNITRATGKASIVGNPRGNYVTARGSGACKTQ